MKNPDNLTRKATSNVCMPHHASDAAERFVRSAPIALAVNFKTICMHEAAHAVMRWLLGERATMIEAEDQGGYCHGTGKGISAENALLIALAGFAAETGYGLYRPVFETSQADDIDHARALIHEHLNLRTHFFEIGTDGTPFFTTGDRLLEKWFDRACQKLRPYQNVIEHLGRRLEQCGAINARSVAATIRQAVKLEKLSRI